jgi:hypothetical protein
MAPNTEEDTLAAKPPARGFDWFTLLWAGIGGAVLYAQIHLLFFWTDADFTDFGAFLGVLVRYFGLVIVGFVAIGVLARKRRKGVGLSFMDCLVHSIVMTFLWLGLTSVYEYTFAVQYPTHTAEVIESKIRKYEVLKAQNDSIIRKLRDYGPEAHQRSEQNKWIMTALPAMREGAQIIRTTEPSFVAILQDRLASYLIMGLLWGVVTGVIFMRRR